jgi:hypothetical protein
MGAYDRWELKLSKQVAPLLKEWCDHLFFCNYQTFVVTSENDTPEAAGWQARDLHDASSRMGCQDRVISARGRGSRLQEHRLYLREKAARCQEGSPCYPADNPHPASEEKPIDTLQAHGRGECHRSRHSEGRCIQGTLRHLCSHRHLRGEIIYRLAHQVLAADCETRSMRTSTSWS